MSSSDRLRVLMPMHPGFDVMDFFGPMEIFSLAQTPASNGQSTSRAFKITVAATEPLTKTYPGAKVASDISLQEAYEKLADFDMLVIPGGASAEILKSHAEPMKLIKAFASVPGRSTSPRTIMSVCTGALFLATAGVLKGQTATTNSQHLEQLREMVPAAETTVVEGPRRFVVNPVGGVKGMGLEGYRIITSAGPGAGLDLSLWFVEHHLGQEERARIEKLMEHEGRLGEGLVLG